MKNIKNLNIKKALLPILLTTLGFSLTGCGNEDAKLSMENTSFVSLIDDEDVKDITLIDELLEADKLSYDEITLLEQADKLEKYISIIKLTRKVDYTDVEKLEALPENKLDNVDKVELETIQELIEVANNEDTNIVSMEKKLEALKRLKHINDTCSEWVLDNGRYITERMMLTSVKASIASELGYTVDDYKKISIDPSHEPDLFDSGCYITIDDKSRLNVPTSADEIYDTVEYIYALQSAKFTDETRNREIESYRKGLNYAKVTIATGSNVKKKKVRVENKFSDIEEKYSKSK